MKKDYSATEERIRELVPRVCFIQQCTDCGGDGYNIDSECCEECGGSGDFSCTKITLEDILEAIRNKDKFLECFFCCSGMFLKSNKNQVEHICDWQYGKTFPEQKSETKEFIKQLLK